tara:strand:+ start:526 stop:708 length:183 start_codon:yes stop_codon:yes gene_type:complete
MNGYLHWFTTIISSLAITLAQIIFNFEQPYIRSNISFLVSAMAFAGFKDLGQVFVQFIIV